MKFFEGYSQDGFWWFRIWGYGLHGKNIIKHGLLFSERYGHRKYIKIGTWIIKFIKYTRTNKQLK